MLSEEEDKFNKTIDQGLTILADMEERVKAAGSTVLSGDDAFKLYDTYGFPLDLTKEILSEKNITVDEEEMSLKDALLKRMMPERPPIIWEPMQRFMTRLIQ